MLDDHARFSDALSGKFYSQHFAQFGIGMAILKYFNYKILLMGPETARFIYLVSFMIPLSLVVHRINVEHFKFHIFPSSVAVIIIASMPSQTLTPVFIDGSYQLVGGVFFFLAVYFLISYLRAYSHKAVSHSKLFLALVFWIISNHTYAEMTIFLFPALVPLFIYGVKHRGRLIFSATLFTSVIAWKLFVTLSVNRGGTGELVFQDLQTVLQRLDLLLKFSSPISFESVDYVTYLISTLLVLCGAVVFRMLKSSKNKHSMIGLVFYSSVFFCGVLPYLFFTTGFRVRYLYTGNIGLWVCLIFVVWYLSRIMLGKYNKAIQIVIACFLVVLTANAGYERKHIAMKTYKSYNAKHVARCDAFIAHASLRYREQIVLTGDNAGTGENYNWSSGYIQACFNRRDINGLIGKEYSFYDPFNISEQAYQFTMSGLDLTRPITFIRRVGIEFISVPYALRWLDPSNIESEWIIYAKDECSDKLKEKLRGKGIKKYYDALESNNIQIENVMFGNPASHSAKRKFSL